MLKRDHTLSLSTQARAPGFRVELKGHDVSPDRLRRLDGRRGRQARRGAQALARADPADAGIHRRDGHRRHRRDRHRGRLAPAADRGGLGEGRAAHPLCRRHRSPSASSSRRCSARGNAERPKLEKRAPGQQLIEDATKALTGVWHDAVLLTGFLGEVTAGARPHVQRAMALPHHLLRPSSRPCGLARRAHHRADLPVDRRRGDAARRGAAQTVRRRALRRQHGRLSSPCARWAFCSPRSWSPAARARPSPPRSGR